MTDGWTDNVTERDDVDFEISCSRFSFRPIAWRGGVLAHLEKITLSSHSRVLFRSAPPFHAFCKVDEAIDQGGITSCNATGYKLLDVTGQ